MELTPLPKDYVKNIKEKLPQTEVNFQQSTSIGHSYDAARPMTPVGVGQSQPPISTNYNDRLPRQPKATARNISPEKHGPGSGLAGNGKIFIAVTSVIVLLAVATVVGVTLLLVLKSK